MNLEAATNQSWRPEQLSQGLDPLINPAFWTLLLSLSPSIPHQHHAQIAESSWALGHLGLPYPTFFANLLQPKPGASRQLHCQLLTSFPSFTHKLNGVNAENRIHLISHLLSLAHASYCLRWESPSLVLSSLELHSLGNPRSTQTWGRHLDCYKTKLHFS